jgi:hypothetical protein
MVVARPVSATAVSNVRFPEGSPSLLISEMGEKLPTAATAYRKRSEHVGQNYRVEFI